LSINEKNTDVWFRHQQVNIRLRCSILGATKLKQCQHAHFWAIIWQVTIMR
jgi:hypothetical protein